MTRTDTIVVGTLITLLAILAALIGGPAIQLAAAPASPSPSVATSPAFEARPYVEGVVGQPSSVSPLTARTQADRDLVALLFAGLVRNGPGGTIVPDLAESWTVDATGKTWTVELRDDARWHDGTSVTPDDVVFTIETLQDPAYKGPSGTSWSEVTVAATGPRQVTFTLATPLGGFLQALTQPIAPVHLLGDTPIEEMADDPFGGLPIGSGAFAITELSETSASLVPAEILRGDGGTVRLAELLARLADDTATDAPPVATDAVPRGHRVPVLCRAGGPRPRLPSGRARRGVRAAARHGRRPCGGGGHPSGPLPRSHDDRGAPQPPTRSS